MVRVTLNMLNDRTLFNLQNNMVRVSTIQEQLSTGRRINRAADDPVDFPVDLNLRASLQLGRSYQSNAQGARSNLELTETTLGSATDVIQQIRTLAVQGASDFDTESRQAIAEQVSILYEQVMELANANYNGKYIFGGGQTKIPAFVNKDGAVVYQGDNYNQKVALSNGQSITSNLNGYDTFLSSPNSITASVGVQNINRPLSEQLRIANPNFPNLPPIAEKTPGAAVDPSPNSKNYPGVDPNNLASFTIHGTEIKVDLTTDSLKDVKDRINAKVSDVVASINDKNQLVITSKRSDALDLQDGAHPIGFEADPPFGINLLGALGMHRHIDSSRFLTMGYPATNPLTNPNAVPTPQRAVVRVQNDSFLFAASNTGPANDPRVPIGDNLALTNVDENGKEAFLNATTPEFINDLEAIRVTIDDQVIDIDLRALTQGQDFDAITGNADDVPGSTLEDLLGLINNHPDLKGRATAYINADGTGISFTAVNSTDVLKVENVRKLFGRDITTQVAIDPLNGDRTITRTDPITAETLLDDLPGALIDSAGTGSLGIRRPVPPPAGQPRNTNEGLIVIHNNGQSATIDLREASTIQDVLDAINNSDVSVQAEINQSGTGINIFSTALSSEPLSVVDVGDGTIARDLGLFAPTAPVRLRSNPGYAGTDLVNGVAPNANAGQFVIEVRDNGGATLEEYAIDVDPNDTLDDIVARIDAADGKAGPGGGLISANIINGVINVVSNFDGHTLVIDPARDTTETDPTRQFTTVTGIAGYTAVDETSVDPPQPYISQQDTASILGLNSNGTVNEVEEHNIFQTLKNLERSLRSDNTEGIQQSLEDIDVDLGSILNQRTKLGARVNRLDASEARLKESEDFMKQELSRVEDADLAQLITDLNLTQNAFNASLQAASRIIQQSLLSYL
ncbi:MAG: flagellar hook-associated protein 3 [bacterium]|nr:flagellar hook-associated protein 3 [bacterium]